MTHHNPGDVENYYMNFNSRFITDNGWVVNNNEGTDNIGFDWSQVKTKEEALLVTLAHEAIHAQYYALFYDFYYLNEGKPFRTWRYFTEHGYPKEFIDIFIKDDKEHWYSNDESIVKIDGNMALVSPNLYSSEVVIEAEITYLGNKANYDFKCIVVGSTYSFYLDDDIAYDPYLSVTVDYDEIYNTNLEVALYLVAFKDLPSNYVTKSEFDKSDYTTENKLSVGGDVFQNREGLLPKDDSYYECDILYAGGSRNALRLVYSLDTLSVYYTSDHYASFDYIYLNGNSSDSVFA